MARPSKKTLKTKLDKLVGLWCRSLECCEALGYSSDNVNPPRKCSTQLQWCHIKSRRYLSVRWSKNNCVCLCAAHHRWFTDNPDEFLDFICDVFPEKLYALKEEFKSVTKMTGVQMEELYDKLKVELSEDRS